jgi:hypothetical protein
MSDVHSPKPASMSALWRAISGPHCRPGNDLSRATDLRDDRRLAGMEPRTSLGSRLRYASLLSGPGSIVLCMCMAYSPD